MRHSVPDRSEGCAWITGASSGIGRALALLLARQGWTVVASGRRAEALDELASSIDGAAGRVVALPLDLTDAEAIADAVARIERETGPIELAVLNAGTHIPDDARGPCLDDLRALVELNILGTMGCLIALVTSMRRRRRGQVAIVASLAGYVGLPGAAWYGLTKAGLINAAESLRPGLAAAGVKLQVVNPGFVATPLTARNDFPMPFLMPAEAAAAALLRGLHTDRFEIVFPWRFAMLMKLLRVLPYRFVFAVTRRLVQRRAADGTTS